MNFNTTAGKSKGYSVSYLLFEANVQFRHAQIQYALAFVGFIYVEQYILTLDS